MSMIGNLLRVTNAELEEYLNDSSLLENRVYNEETEEGEPNLVDIDKSWEGILFLLTGQNLEIANHPLTATLFSGQFIDEEQDLGYGPAQYLTPVQVKEIDAEISKITTEEISRKFDAAKMTELEIYPTVWKDNDALDYLIEYFKLVQEVYATAAKNNEAIITFIN